MPAHERRTIWLLAASYGLTIADLYYCQPLLPQISRSYGSDGAVGALTAAGQLGYALALMLIVPLGDIVRRRRLVTLLLCADAAALGVTAGAASVEVLLAAAVVVGLTSAAVVNVLAAYAAGLAGDRQRGRVVATVLNGGLAGVLLSRAVAGLVADAVGWRALFSAAAVVTLALAGVLARVLPAAPPQIALGYGRQLRATLRLAVHEPVLRRRSLIGACVFAGFTLFWATVAFRLAASPYHFGETQIGLFALVGVAGALAAWPARWRRGRSDGPPTEAGSAR